MEEGEEEVEVGEEEEEVEMRYWVVRQTINQLTANCLFLSKTYTIHSTTINNPLYLLLFLLQNQEFRDREKTFSPVLS